MSAGLTEFAAAKLNLALHVTCRTADGYHQLDSLVCFAGAGDVVKLSPGPLRLEVDGPFADALCADADNLCLRAAEMAGADISIRLTKNLPVASGIGGGSADAAAVLRGLKRMGYPIPVNLGELGADIPVCLKSQPARMQGIGERLTMLPPLPRLHLVLVNPGLPLSTPQVFAALRSRNNPPLRDIPDFADFAELVDWLGHTRNDMEDAAVGILPVIGDVLVALTSCGAAFVRMSGSGATCFGLFDTAGQATQAAETLQRNGWWSVATELAQPPHCG